MSRRWAIEQANKFLMNTIDPAESVTTIQTIGWKKYVDMTKKHIEDLTDMYEKIYAGGN